MNWFTSLINKMIRFKHFNDNKSLTQKFNKHQIIKLKLTLQQKKYPLCYSYHFYPKNQ